MANASDIDHSHMGRHWTEGMLGDCSNEWAYDIGGRNDTGEDKLERRMVDSW